MLWEAEVVVVFIGILAPLVALFGVLFLFTIHITQKRTRTTVRTPTTMPIITLLESERQIKEQLREFCSCGLKRTSIGTYGLKIYLGIGVGAALEDDPE